MGKFGSKYPCPPSRGLGHLSKLPHCKLPPASTRIFALEFRSQPLSVFIGKVSSNDMADCGNSRRSTAAISFAERVGLAFLPTYRAKDNVLSRLTVEGLNLLHPC